MAEVKLFYHKDGIVRLSRSLEFLKSNPIQNFLWIDLNDVDEEIENELEDFLKIYIQEEEEMIEIEMSSRYIETNDTLIVNSNFLLSNFETDPVSFILKNNILVTVRSEELISFHETVKKDIGQSQKLSYWCPRAGCTPGDPSGVRCRHDREYDTKDYAAK